MLDEGSLVDGVLKSVVAVVELVVVVGEGDGLERANIALGVEREGPAHVVTVKNMLEQGDVEAGTVGPMQCDQVVGLAGYVAEPKNKLFQGLLNMRGSIWWSNSLSSPPVHGLSFKS